MPDELFPVDELVQSLLQQNQGVSAPSPAGQVNFAPGTQAQYILPIQGRIAGGFGDSRNRGARLHKGGDIVASPGSPVVAPADMEYVAGGIGGTNLRDNDSWAHFKDVNTGRQFRFAHIAAPPDFKPGQIIPKGTAWGAVGSAIDNPHLHMSVVDPDKGHVDWMKEAGLSRGQEIGEQGQPQGQGDYKTLAEKWKENPAALQKMADDVADHYGVPRDIFKALVGHESSWNPLARNPKSSATGIGQFLDKTAQSYFDEPISPKGESPNDPRYHPGKSMDAAARLLVDNYKRTGNWADAIKSYGEGTEEYLQRVIRQWKKDQVAEKPVGLIGSAIAGAHEGTAKTAGTLLSLPARATQYLMEKAGAMGFPESSPEELAKARDIAQSTEGGVERAINPTPYGPSHGFINNLVRGLASGGPELAGLALAGLAVPEVGVPAALAKISPLAARLLPAMAKGAGTFGLWDIMKGQGPEQAAIGAGMGAVLPFVGPTYGRLARLGYGGGVGGAATLAQTLTQEGRLPSAEELGQGAATMGLFHAVGAKRTPYDPLGNLTLDLSQFAETPKTMPKQGELPGPGSQLMLPGPQGPLPLPPGTVISGEGYDARPIQEVRRRPGTSLADSVNAVTPPENYPPVLERLPGANLNRPSFMDSALGLRPQDVMERLVTSAAGMPESAGLGVGGGIGTQLNARYPVPERRPVAPPEKMGESISQAPIVEPAPSGAVLPAAREIKPLGLVGQRVKSESEARDLATATNGYAFRWAGRGYYVSPQEPPKMAGVEVTHRPEIVPAPLTNKDRVKAAEAQKVAEQPPVTPATAPITEAAPAVEPEQKAAPAVSGEVTAPTPAVYQDEAGWWRVEGTDVKTSSKLLAEKAAGRVKAKDEKPEMITLADGSRVSPAWAKAHPELESKGSLGIKVGDTVVIGGDDPMRGQVKKIVGETVLGTTPVWEIEAPADALISDKYIEKHKIAGKVKAAPQATVTPVGEGVITPKSVEAVSEKKPWEASKDNPVEQIKAVAFKKRNGMGGRPEIENTEKELIKLFSGDKLTNKEILKLHNEFNLSEIGLHIGGSYNPKHTQGKFESFREEIKGDIKARYLDPLTESTPTPPEKAKAPTPQTTVQQGGGEGKFETVYRGEGGTSKKDGGYWSPNAEWAAQFTQTGELSTVKQGQIKTSDIYEPTNPIYAGDPDAIDAGIKDARAKGFKAIRLDEGANEPMSVHVFDRTAIKSIGPYRESTPDLTAARALRDKFGTSRKVGKPAPAVLQGMKDWLENKTYIDNAGNYRLSETKKIAPWNKEVKAAFPESEGLSEAAQKQYPDIVAAKEKVKADRAALLDNRQTIKPKTDSDQMQALPGMGGLFEPAPAEAKKGEGKVYQIGDQPIAPKTWTADDLKKFYGSDVRVFESKLFPGVMEATFPSGIKGKFLQDSTIELDTASLEKGYSKKELAPGEYLAGEFRKIGPNFMVKVASGEGIDTLAHEGLGHMVYEMFATPREQKALLKKWGDKEGAANGLGGEMIDWFKSGGKVGEPANRTLFQKVKDFFTRFLDAVHPTWKSVVRKMQSGEIYGRVAKDGKVAVDPQYKIKDDADQFQRKAKSTFEDAKVYTSWLKEKITTPNLSLRERYRQIMPEVTSEDMTYIGKLGRLMSWKAKEDPDAAKIWDITKTARMEVPSQLRVTALKTLEPLLSMTNPKELNEVGALLMEGDKINQSGKPLKEQQAAFDDLLARAKKQSSPQVYEAFASWHRFATDSWKLDAEKFKAMGVSQAEIFKLRQEMGRLTGYFPHVWDDGKYYIMAYNKAGEPLYRDVAGRFNLGSKLDKVKKQFPGARVDYGKNEGLPEDMFFALSPVHSELLARMAVEKSGLPADVADKLIQTMADSLKARGFGSHYIKRQNVPGYITDPMRIPEIVTNYIQGWAGWRGKMEAAPQYFDALGKIDAKSKPKFYSFAENYVRDALENSSRTDRALGKLRNVMYLKYIPGVMSTATLNMTQPFVTLAPYMSTQTKGSFVKVAGAMKDLAKDGKAYWQFINGKEANWKHLKVEEGQAMKDIFAAGHMQDYLTKELLGNQLGIGGKIWERSMDFLSFPFSNAEKYNRAVSALMAFRVFRNEKKMDYESAMKKAAQVVDDTQFVYGKYNLPEGARTGAAGKAFRSTGYVFKQYMHNYGELLAHLAKQPGGLKAIGKSAGIIALLGGPVSMPIISSMLALAKGMGYDPMAQMFNGTDKENNLLHTLFRFGIPGFLGVDFSGPIGVQLPGEMSQSIGQASTDILLGPPGRILTSDLPKMADAWKRGEPGKAVEAIAPRFAKLPLQAMREGSEGVTTKRGQQVADEYGRPIKLTPTEALTRFLGFQPTRSTIRRENQEFVYEHQQARQAQQDMWATRAVNAIRDQNPAALQEVINSVTLHNQKAMQEGEPPIILQNLIANRMKPKMTPRIWRGFAMKNQ